MQFHEIRRLDDGTIDFDFYRAQVMAARGEAMRDAFKLKAAFGFVLITLTLIVCVTIVASVIGPTTSYLPIGLGMLCIGGGMGFAMPTTSIAAQNAVDTRDLGISTATVTFFRSLGGSVALAVFGTIFNSKLTQELVQRVPESSGRTGKQLASLIRSPKEIKALEESLRDAVTASISAGVARVFLIAIPGTVLAFLISWKMKEIPLRATGGMSTVPVE